MTPLDETILLASGLLVRDDRALLVASRYANHAQPLWNLPGGRCERLELLRDTVVREVLEETGLRADAGRLAYVSESYDGATHFLNATFIISAQGEPDARGVGDHVVAVEFVPIAEVESRVAVRVVREPLLQFLRGELTAGYVAYREAGVTIRWE